jgi:hypothetical protein
VGVMREVRRRGWRRGGERTGSGGVAAWWWCDDTARLVVGGGLGGGRNSLSYAYGTIRAHSTPGIRRNGLQQNESCKRSFADNVRIMTPLSLAAPICYPRPLFPILFLSLLLSFSQRWAPRSVQRMAAPHHLQAGRRTGRVQWERRGHTSHGEAEHASRRRKAHHPLC